MKTLGEGIEFTLLLTGSVSSKTLRNIHVNIIYRNSLAPERGQLFRRQGLKMNVSSGLFLLITLVTQSFMSDNQFDWLFDLINMVFDQIDSTIQLKWQDYKQS